MISGSSTQSPSALLEKLKEIEKAMGRDFQAPRWAPRLIDLDILAWGDQVLHQEGLTIPHPELLNRPFLLRLMAMLQSSWRYPVLESPYAKMTLDEIIHKYIPTDSQINNCFTHSPQLVGIINITPDSFSDGGHYFCVEKAIQRILEVTKQGASVIDIGVQSTRPGAIYISPEEEWNRLKPVLKNLTYEFSHLPAKPLISIDSYHSDVIQKALQIYPISWINDVKGGEDPRLLKIVAETKCKIVLNHSLTVPPTRQTILPFETNSLSYILDWAERKLEQLHSLGISKDRVILDPGIGFGKSECQSISLLREINHLKKLGCETLIGHSRKSFLNMVCLEKSDERDFETIGISHYLFRKGVDYLRVHNVEAHQRSLTACALLENKDYDFS